MKKLASVLFVLMIVTGLIFSASYGILLGKETGSVGGGVLAGVIMLLFFVLYGWIGGLCTYAWGHMIDNVDAIKTGLDDIQAVVVQADDTQPVSALPENVQPDCAQDGE